MTPFPTDPEAGAQNSVFALVSTGKRNNRKRFAEGCVRQMPDAESAIAQASVENGTRAALVYGPSFSSESQRVYHLIRWLG